MTSWDIINQCKNNCNGYLTSEKVKNSLEKAATGCTNCKNRKTVWKSKNLSERIENIIIYLLPHVKLMHLLAAWNGDILWPLISLWYKKYLIIVQNRASLFENFHMLYALFLSKTSWTLCKNFLQDLGPLLQAPGWLQSLWCGSPLKQDSICLLYWSPSGLTVVELVQFVLPLLWWLRPPLWDWRVLLLEMVWSLLRSI